MYNDYISIQQRLIDFHPDDTYPKQKIGKIESIPYTL